MATEQQSVFSGRVRYLSIRVNPNEISLLPYSRIGGDWTLSDDIVLGIARQCEKEGTFKRVFCEGGVGTPEEFLAEMQKPTNIPVFIYRGTDPVGFAWLNGIAGNHAFAHFCFLSSAWGPPAEEAGRMLLDYWMSFGESEGAPVFDVIIGTTPETSVLATRFAQRVGFVRLGSIPRMIVNKYTGKHCAAVILYYVRPPWGCQP